MQTLRRYSSKLWSTIWGYSDCEQNYCDRNESKIKFCVCALDKGARFQGEIYHCRLCVLFINLFAHWHSMGFIGARAEVCKFATPKIVRCLMLPFHPHFAMPS